MVLGQSAATAAALALDQDVDVQALPYRVLEARLRADGQVLDHGAANSSTGAVRE
jgi:hypothetical protein